jgi:heme exporter protein B
VSVLVALLRKELRLELRTLESVPGMALFSVTTFVVFHFGLNKPTVDGDLAAGILVVTLLFAGMLGLNRLYVADEEQGGFDGFLLAPVDRTWLFIAKAIALFTYLVVLEIVMVPAFVLLLLGPSLSLGELGPLVGVLAMADAGFAIIAALVGAIAVRTRARDLIGPLMALPLLVPVVISTSRALQPLLSAGPHDGPAAKWLAILALYDLVFGLLAVAVFDPLLED